MEFVYDMQISGIVFRISAPFELTLPECLTPFFMKPSDRKTDFLFQIQTGEEENGEGFRRKYILDSNRRIVCFEPTGHCNKADIYIPADFIGQFAKNANWLLYMALERQLLRFGRTILHASAVVYRGSAYVFTAPSGVGKSTQAFLWEKYTGAEIINGDKVILYDNGQELMAYGSPIAGSSGIYKKTEAPVAAIIRLDQGVNNSVSVLNTLESFLLLYSEAVKSDCDEAYNNKLLETMTDYPSRTRFVKFSCKPDQTAVYDLLEYFSGLD